MNQVPSTPNGWLIIIGLGLALVAIVVYGYVSLVFVQRLDGRPRRSLVAGLALGSGFAVCSLTTLMAWSAFDFWPLVVLVGLGMAVLGTTSLWSPVGLVWLLSHKTEDKKQ